MSDLLNQAKAAATSAINTASNLANQAANSQAAATVAEQAKTLGSQASAAAGAAATQASNLAGQAHAQAHAVAPSIVPPPATSGTVDTRGDLSPTNEKDKQKLEKLFGARADPHDLQEKGILKGAPGDTLAGKRAELEKSMLEDRLDKEIAERPAAEELVKRGILNADEAPPHK